MCIIEFFLCELGFFETKYVKVCAIRIFTNIWRLVLIASIKTAYHTAFLCQHKSCRVRV